MEGVLSIALPMTDLKQLARRIFQDTLAAIDIPETMRRKMQREGSRIRCGSAVVDLREFRALEVIAYGKASHALAEGLAGVLGPEFPFVGIVSAPTAPQRPLAGLRYFTGGHPLPNEASLAAAQEILARVAGCEEHTLLIFLLSGGGSGGATARARGDARGCAGAASGPGHLRRAD